MLGTLVIDYSDWFLFAVNHPAELGVHFGPIKNRFSLLECQVSIYSSPSFFSLRKTSRTPLESDNYVLESAPFVCSLSHSAPERLFKAIIRVLCTFLLPLVHNSSKFTPSLRVIRSVLDLI